MILSSVCTVKVSAINITENLLFAISAKKDTDDFTISLKRNQQPSGTVYFFKISFSLYMLVSVIVMINLLIAMMSDTYHKVISQSDIEWKYGLSKLIRKMQKTKTAPAPLNLITTWTEYLKSVCIRKRNARQKIDRSHGYMEPDVHQRDFPKYPLSSNNRIIPRTKDSVNFSLLQLSPANSQSSLSNISRIDNVVDWDTIRRKYRMQFCGKIEKSSDGVAKLARMA
ncbi:transient receptor potential-gamma protein-like [Camponotus floridanus]|uniref:transient receptor potential-gamma protein-like n=1 Tax=Camponotus floridanus TaxID=104421 RepID=UPI000DC6A932|nr:transient receptor potential-gamma protein-like [Camponotus floridanus]